MSVLLIVVGFALLATPAVLEPLGLGRRIAPAEWCRMVVGCLWTGQAAVHAGLWFAFAPVLLRAVGAHGLAHASHGPFTAGMPSPSLVGWLAGAALVAAHGRSMAARRRTNRSQRVLRAEPWLGEHRLDDGVDLVTLPCAEPLAYAIPGRPGWPGWPDQITVTDGLATALDDEEMDAVVRHEHAHLRLGHHEVLALGGEIEAELGWFGPTRRSVAGLRLAVERWADEDAGSGSEPARRAVRRALLKTIALALGPTPAFTEVDTIAARLDALAAPPTRSGWWARCAALTPMVALSTVGGGAVTACALAAHHGVGGLLGHCPF